MTPSAETTKGEFETALCGPGDRAEQARLFNACFQKRVEARHLAWRYDENPHGAAVSLLARPSGDAGGDPADGVCGYACSPRIAVPRGRRAEGAPVGQTGDVMTHPDWRKRGIFSGLDRACMAETARLGWPLAFGLPNRRSAHIFQQLGWETVGRVRPWTLVLRADAASRAARLVDGRWAAWSVPLAARRGRAARRELRARAGDAWRIEPLERFPAEVDELSARVEADFAWMVRRDAAYLDWRFLRNPSGRHRVLGAFDGAGAFAGYVVVEPPTAGEAAGYLVDVLAPDDAARAALLSAGIDALERAGASYVRATAIDGSWWQDRLEDCGFQPPKADNHLIVILHPHDADHPLVAAARDTERWYFTDGDRDDEAMGG